MDRTIAKRAIAVGSALAVVSLMAACSSGSSGGASPSPTDSNGSRSAGTQSGDLIRISNGLGVTITTKVPAKSISTGWSAASNPGLPQPNGLQNNQITSGQQYNVFFDTPGAGEASAFTLQLIANGKAVGSVNLEFQKKSADETGFAPADAGQECSWGQSFTYTLLDGKTQKADWGGHCHNGNTYIDVLDEEPNPWA